VLVVDDSEDTAQSFAELLTLCGHAVRTAGTGPEALRAAAAEAPDVVLLDIGLPGMSGWEVARRLRAQAVDKQPLLVAVTGFGSVADHHRSADAGIDLHLTKPTAPDALIAFLSWVCDNLAARRPTGTSL
jgi:DNA-binding response OmpR family regulator